MGALAPINVSTGIFNLSGTYKKALPSYKKDYH